MEITFDPAKDATNLAKHGVSLAFGARIWCDPLAIFVPTERIEDGERRFRAIEWWMKGYGQLFTSTAMTSFE